MAEPICLYKGEKLQFPASPTKKKPRKKTPTPPEPHPQNPTLLHSAKFIETIISRNGTSAAGAGFAQADYFRGSSSLFLVLLDYCWKSNFFHEMFIHLLIIPIGSYRQNGNYYYCCYCCFAPAALGVPEGNTRASGIEPRRTRGTVVSALPALPSPIPCSAPVTRAGALPSPALGL